MPCHYVAVRSTSRKLCDPIFNIRNFVQALRESICLRSFLESRYASKDAQPSVRERVISYENLHFYKRR